MITPYSFSYESMGTGWEVSVWDDVDEATMEVLKADIIRLSTEFDQTYSRFIKTSLVWELTKKTGTVEVPNDLVQMLRLYAMLHDSSGGKLNPLVGFALSDLGYDAKYSLKKKDVVRPVPTFHDTLHIIDDTHIELMDSVLIDLGALGKGYFVDKITDYLKEKGFRRFLVNGSGDIYYSGDGHALRAGLEHPDDSTKVIGVLELTEGALCASAGNRRTWGEYHHAVDPHSLTSPSDIKASWVLAASTVLADGLCTCLLLTEPECYSSLSFDYCLLNPSCNMKRSAGFTAELF